jgi:hypothetical protein
MVRGSDIHRRQLIFSCCVAALNLAGCATAPRTAAAIRLAAPAERRRILANAERWRTEPASTITDFPAARSPGDQHDYYSEGDYWWPDPANPGGPYVRRDGISNPNRFECHRLALIRLSIAAPALAAAWRISGDKSYAVAALAHLRAWFANPRTMMAPHLEHAQAIIGVNAGRGIGIIDTLHLVEVARAIKYLVQGGVIEAEDEVALLKWFSDYLLWLRTSPNGLDESDEKNNHGTCYALQVAAFADLVGAPLELAWVRRRFRETLIPDQIAVDGSQPLELARTKPFGYCLFNLDALAAVAFIASTAEEDLWAFETGDGRSLRAALAYMAPFIANKSAWPHIKDIQYWDEWPVRHPALLFGAMAFGEEYLLRLWAGLEADPQTPEILRNFPIRQPALWTDNFL